MNLEALRKKMRCPNCGSSSLAVKTYIEGSQLNALKLVEKANGFIDFYGGKVVRKAHYEPAGQADQPIFCRKCYYDFDEVRDLLAVWETEGEPKSEADNA